VITIIHEEGCETRTQNVESCNIYSHIRANDRFAQEAKCLLAYMNNAKIGVDRDTAFGWDKKNERLVFSNEDAAEIEHDDYELVRVHYII
jgi:hypothetical protein